MIFAGSIGKYEFKTFHNDVQSAQTYHHEFGLLGLNDSVAFIAIAKNTNLVVVGLLNSDILSFKYKMEHEHEEEKISIEELAEVQLSKLSEANVRRRAISKSLSPFNHGYYV
jgi:hypothetical protein